MIRMTRWAVGMAVFSASVSAFAQEEGPAEEPAPQASANTSVVADANAGESSAADEKKFRLGLRLGYALPPGDAAEGVKLSDGLSGQIPIWLDVGYMVTPNMLVGLYGQYGFAQVKSCDDGADCSAHTNG